MTLGEKIQTLRKSRGWSQEQLAEQIGVTRQALSKWENGGAVPDTANVVQLARLFQVTTDHLLLDDDWEPAVVTRETCEAENTDENGILRAAAYVMLLIGGVGVLALLMMSWSWSMAVNANSVFSLVRAFVAGIMKTMAYPAERCLFGIAVALLLGGGTILLGLRFRNYET